MTPDYRKWLLVSLALMAMVSASSTLVAFSLLYKASMLKEEERLLGLAHSQSRLIEAVAGFDQTFGDKVYPEGALAATLRQVAEAHSEYKGFGATGEFVLGRRDGERIVFLLSQRNYDLARPEPVLADSGLGVPMLLALNGGHGVVRAPDYRGEMVLAAYHWLPTLNAGFVAKIDVREIRAPFIKAGWMAAAGFLGFLVVGGLVFRRISIPLLQHREISHELWKLSHAIEQSPLMVFITDTEGRIEYVNKRFTEMTGYGREEAIGRNPRIIKSCSTPRQVHETMWETIGRGEIWRGEIEDRRKDGTTFWAGSLIAPIQDDTGRTSNFVAIHEDITHRKLAESQMREAARQTELASRAKTELLANMSHELRTPLNAIIGFSGMMIEQVFGPLGSDKYNEYADNIQMSGQHLLDLINDLLDMSAIEAGKVELRDDEVDLTETCETVIRLITPRAEKGMVAISCHQPKKPTYVRADARRLRQMLLNLVSNAVKFTPEGGKVAISVAPDADGGLEIAVADTGIGMDEAGMEKAMQPFGQVETGLDRKYEGTGLGLPLTRELAELHGGRLNMASAPGRGTTASIHLPPERIIKP